MSTTKKDTKASPSSQKQSSYKNYSCHEGNHHIVTVDRTKQELPDLEIWAGGKTRGVSTSGFDVVIGPSTVISGSSIPQGWRISKFWPVIIPVPWPDYGVPKIADAFWDALLEDILERDIQKVLIMCQGGHGRTGTALAVIYHKLFREHETVDELVSHLRSVYCKEIVEATSQFEYIARLTGLEWKKETSVPKSKSYSSYSGYSASPYPSKWNNWPKPGKGKGKKEDEEPVAEVWVDGHQVTKNGTPIWIYGSWVPLDKLVESDRAHTDWARTPTQWELKDMGLTIEEWATQVDDIIRDLYMDELEEGDLEEAPFKAGEEKLGAGDEELIGDMAYWSEASARAAEVGATLEAESGSYYLCFSKELELKFGSLKDLIAWIDRQEEDGK